MGLAVFFILQMIILTSLDYILQQFESDHTIRDVNSFYNRAHLWA